MAFLEDIICKYAAISHTKKYKRKRASEKDIKYIPELFLNILDDDKSVLGKIAFRYLDLRRKKDEQPFLAFLEEYCQLYNKVKTDAKKRDIFQQCVTQLLEYSSQTYTVRRLLTFLSELLDHSPTILSLWVDSLHHLVTGEQKRDTLLDDRLLRYSDISVNELHEHSSHQYVLKQFSEGKSLFNLEELLFDLSEEQDMGENDVERFIEELSRITLPVRRQIEHVRMKATSERKAVNYSIYQLFRLSHLTEADFSHLGLFLSCLDDGLHNVDNSCEILTCVNILNSIYTKKTSMLSCVRQLSESIRHFNGDRVSSFLGVVDYTIGLDWTDIEDVHHCLKITTEVFRDYLFDKNKSIKSNLLQEKCLRNVAAIYQLPLVQRESAFKIIDTFLSTLERDKRLKYNRPIFCDKFVESTIKTISADPQKSSEFIYLTLLGRTGGL